MKLYVRNFQRNIGLNPDSILPVTLRKTIGEITKDASEAIPRKISAS